MNVPTKRLSRACTVLILGIFLTSCDSRASRSEAALRKYQAASAAGDMLGARTALLGLVAVNEDVASYWVELGKVQLALNDTGSAYYAFTRANELDRSNVEVLRYLTQIALQSGQLDAAEERSRELDIVAPGDPVVKITNGLVALRRSEFDNALKQADAILAGAPLDTSSKILKARALVGLGRTDEAYKVLDEQTVLQPQDRGALSALLRLHRMNDDWAPILALGERYSALDPADNQVVLTTIEAAFRTGNVAAGRDRSLKLLTPLAKPELIEQVLSLWSDHWRGSEPIALARRLGSSAGSRQRVAYATYLNRHGDPRSAAALVADQATASPTPATADARAAYYESQWRLGDRATARSSLERLLNEDADNDVALSALAPLLLAIGDHGQALNVARKLVTVEPTEVDPRLGLARAYELAGDQAAATRTLWDAFHDVPAEERIYTALRAKLGGDDDGLRRLSGEFDDQRKRKLMQESIL